MFKLKKSKKQINRFVLGKPDIGFIPYACFYDKDTILTKNGELLQTIRIRGISQTAIAGKSSELRDIVRKTIIENITTNDFAIWLHTVRVKENLDSGDKYPNLFSFDTHEVWCKKNFWRDKFVNELYLTIVIKGASFNLNRKGTVAKNLSLNRLYSKHDNMLKISYNRLKNVIKLMLSGLKDFGAETLTIKEDMDGVYSEQLRFFTKLIQLQDKKVEVPIKDLSEIMNDYYYVFSNNLFEIKHSNEKFYGSVFTIKNYHDLSVQMLDKFLRSPQEFIISQALTFISPKKASDEYRSIREALNISKDEYIKKISGMDKIFEADYESETSFCQTQLSIIIFAPSEELLLKEIRQSVEELSRLGIVFVKEDLNAESIYWSQLPANFSRIARNQITKTEYFGGFASLHNSPSGKTYNKWGNALTIFRTKLGTPHFFNLHLDENGHTIILGPKSSGKATMINFLLSESCKYKPKIMYIDQYITSKTTMLALGASYVYFNKDGSSNIKINPFLLENNDINIVFLYRLIHYIVFEDCSMFSEEIKIAIDSLMSLPKEQRNIASLVTFLEDQELKNSLKEWHGDGKYTKIFNNDYDDFINHSKLECINISNLINQNTHEAEKSLVPVVAYFIHYFNASLDGITPSIIVINDADTCLNNSYFMNQLDNWYKYLSDSNAISILLQKNSNVIKNEFNDFVYNNVATKIFLPNISASEDFHKIVGLSDLELQEFNNMRIINRHFMIKQDQQSVIAELNLDALTHALPILSGSKKLQDFIDSSEFKYDFSDPNKYAQFLYASIDEMAKKHELM